MHQHSEHGMLATCGFDKTVRVWSTVCCSHQLRLLTCALCPEAVFQRTAVGLVVHITSPLHAVLWQLTAAASSVVDDDISSVAHRMEL
jgi:hypothetical protein